LSQDPTKEDIRLAFIAEIGAARRRLQAIDKQWCRSATTEEELRDAREVLYISWLYLRKLQTATIELNAALACRKQGVPYI
jgi:hypothetical protein